MVLCSSAQGQHGTISAAPGRAEGEQQDTPSHQGTTLWWPLTPTLLWPLIPLMHILQHTQAPHERLLLKKGLKGLLCSFVWRRWVFLGVCLVVRWVGWIDVAGTGSKERQFTASARTLFVCTLSISHSWAICHAAASFCPHHIFCSRTVWLYSMSGTHTIHSPLPHPHTQRQVHHTHSACTIMRVIAVHTVTNVLISNTVISQDSKQQWKVKWHH